MAAHKHRMATLAPIATVTMVRLSMPPPSPAVTAEAVFTSGSVSCCNGARGGAGGAEVLSANTGAASIASMVTDKSVVDRTALAAAGVLSRALSSLAA